MVVFTLANLCTAPDNANACCRGRSRSVWHNLHVSEWPFTRLPLQSTFCAIAVHTIYLTGLLPRVTYQENCATGATENTCNWNCSQESTSLLMTSTVTDDACVGTTSVKQWQKTFGWILDGIVKIKRSYVSYSVVGSASWWGYNCSASYVDQGQGQMLQGSDSKIRSVTCTIHHCHKRAKIPQEIWWKLTEFNWGTINKSLLLRYFVHICHLHQICQIKPWQQLTWLCHCIGWLRCQCTQWQAGHVRQPFVSILAENGKYFSSFTWNCKT